MKNKKAILSLLLLLFFLAISVSSVSAADSGNFTYFQDIIDSNGSDSTITLDRDIQYVSGDLNTHITISNNNVTIDGMGYTVNGTGSFDLVFNITGNGIILKNITITGGNNINGSGGGIFNQGDRNYLIGVNVIHNTAYNGSGIYNIGHEFTILNDNIINYNTATSAGGGIYNIGHYVSIGDNNQISYNTVKTKYNGTGGGIYNTGDLFTIYGNNSISYNEILLDGVIAHWSPYLEGAGIYNINDHPERMQVVTISGGLNNISNNNIRVTNSNLTGYYIFIFGAGISNWQYAGNFIMGGAIVSNNGIFISNSSVDYITIEGANFCNYHPSGVSLIDNSTLNNGVISVSNVQYDKLDALGAGAYNYGNLDIYNSTFENNGDSTINGSAICNDFNGNMGIFNCYISGPSHLIFNNYAYEGWGKNGELYLENNTMVPSTIEAIYNLGLITSTVHVIYLNNTTITRPFNYIEDVKGRITDDMGNVVVGQNLTFVIRNPDGTNYTKQVPSWKDGYYSLNYTLNQIGTFIVDGTYIPGALIQNHIHDYGIINVVKSKTTTTINDVTGKPGQTVTITGTVVDEMGNNINGVVNVTLPDGKNVNVNVVDGEFNYDWTIPYGLVGKKNISADFEGDKNYLPSNDTGIATINKLETEIISGDITGKPGQTVTINGIVVDENGNLVNGTINIILPDGTSVNVDVVDGEFSYDWTIPKDFKSGNYTIGLIFDENEFYLSSNTNIILTVIVDPTPNPTPKPTNKDAMDVEKLEKTGNSIVILLLALISCLILPLKRRL
ncbi:Ig-like domain repeat protein [Methanobrevibacter sp. OttesenSCG-928-K11]|nr:Ig-like domain repeat protein [Methanobrevibacter sp. OttesenSCG-928-K11]MDL2270755.1 Ig-like domain repeat protein [Methanobrevibacter sp. OttesenSCG-928-I08]